MIKNQGRHSLPTITDCKGEVKMANNSNQTLHNHLVAVKEGERCFEMLSRAFPG